MFMDTLSTFHSDDLGKLLIRASVGGLLIFHGIAKLLHGIAWIPPMLQMHGLPGPLAYGVFVAEIIAPILILMGWKTRLLALTIVFEMVVVILLVFRDMLFSVKPSGGGWSIELEVFFLLGSAALFFLGSGKFSVSRGRGKWD